MTFGRTLTAFAIAAAFAFGAMSNTASADEKHKNLKVVKDTGKELDVSMKAFSKGLGVKCNACHVKGEFDSDKVEAKGSGRTFLTAAVGEKDQAKRDAALTELLKALKLEKAKDPKAVWAGVDTFKKK